MFITAPVEVTAITPLDPLIKRCHEQADRTLLETVKKNAVDLLDMVMVNTLLDFRKLEINSEHLHQSLVNVVEYTGTYRFGNYRCHDAFNGWSGDVSQIEDQYRDFTYPDHHAYGSGHG